MHRPAPWSSIYPLAVSIAATGARTFSVQQNEKIEGETMGRVGRCHGWNKRKRSVGENWFLRVQTISLRRILRKHLSVACWKLFALNSRVEVKFPRVPSLIYRVRLARLLFVPFHCFTWCSLWSTSVAFSGQRTRRLWRNWRNRLYTGNRITSWISFDSVFEAILCFLRLQGGTELFYVHLAFTSILKYRGKRFGIDSKLRYKSCNRKIVLL